MSAVVTGLAGILLLFNNRMTSADPIGVPFSGELLAMVVIGGMRSFLGPALGALFFVLFRDYLSSVTPDWLFYFGLLFVLFIVFSPSGLVGVYERMTRPWRKVTDRVRRDGEPPDPRGGVAAVPRAAAIGRGQHPRGARPRQELRRDPGGRRRQLRGCRPVAACAHRPQRRRQDDGLQPHLRHVRPRRAARFCWRASRSAGLSPDRATRAGIGRSFQITNLFGGAECPGERAARGAGARPAALRHLDAGAAPCAGQRRDRCRSSARWGSRASRRRRRARCPTAASACSTCRSRSRCGRACCCSTSRWRAFRRPSASASAT